MSNKSNNSNSSNLKPFWLVFDVSIVLLLSLIFGWLYLVNHSWGAWGDDSPGYIYTAAQLVQHKPLVAQSNVVRSALQYFGNEPWARLAAPTHHDIISPSGWIASKYPIGLGIVLYVGGYVVVPLLAVLTVIFTYLLAVLMLPVSAYTKRGVGILAAITLGVTELFSSYAVSQPMRDIPALAFFLAAVLITIFALTKISTGWLRNSAVILAGALFGYSVNIRETSAVLFITIIAIFYCYLSNRKMIWKVIGLFSIGMVIVGSVSIWNSAVISAHKEKFKSKDITSLAITSNFDHIQSLSLVNLYNNQGKYKRGVGGVNQYLVVLQEEFSFWPPFLLMAVIGIVALWIAQRRLAYVFISWFGSIFILFSAWINPYARYILPLLPVVTVLGGYGITVTMVWLQKKLHLGKISFFSILVLLLVSLCIGTQPLVASRIQHVTQQKLVNKAITYQDLQNFKNIGHSIAEDQVVKPPLVLVIGFWQAGAAEMLMSNNDQIIAIRYPRKRQEQPPVDDMVGWLQQLSEHYQLYLWYDDSATITEQQLRQHFTVEPVVQTDFSFQPQVQINRISTIQ